MHTFLRFIFLCFTLANFGQNSPTKITGTIYDDLGKVVNAHIINTTTKQGTFTDDNGAFTCKVSLGDVLEITSIQHHHQKITIANIILKKKEISIKLSLKNHVLDEVVVKKHNLQGVLELDLKDVPEDKGLVLSENALDFSNIDFEKPVITKIDAINRMKAPNMSKQTDPTAKFAGAGGSIGGKPDVYGVKLRALRKEITFKERFPKLLIRWNQSGFVPTTKYFQKPRFYFCQRDRRTSLEFVQSQRRRVILWSPFRHFFD